MQTAEIAPILLSDGLPLAPPSDWVRRWTPVLVQDLRHLPVLDVACGKGRHLAWLQRQGLPVWGVDRDVTALQAAAAHTPEATLVCADLEQAAWPFQGMQWGALIVTHYLWRPLWPSLLQAVAPGGWLIYETFSAEQARIGRPARADFLLQPGELLQRCAGWHITAYEEGLLEYPTRCVQRIAARRPMGLDESIPACVPLLSMPVA